MQTHVQLQTVYTLITVKYVSKKKLVVVNNDNKNKEYFFKKGYNQNMILMNINYVKMIEFRMAFSMQKMLSPFTSS